MKTTLAIAFMAAAMMANTIQADINVGASRPQKGKPLGAMGVNRYDQNSVANPYGAGTYATMS